MVRSFESVFYHTSRFALIRFHILLAPTSSCQLHDQQLCLWFLEEVLVVCLDVFRGFQELLRAVGKQEASESEVTEEGRRLRRTTLNNSKNAQLTCHLEEPFSEGYHRREHHQCQLTERCKEQET